MSGIVGVFSKNDNADLRYIVKKMLEMIKHRGNKSIIYSNKNVTIGFRQLKSNEEKKEQNNSNIVFIDGLIYNTNFVAGKNPHSLVDSDEDILDYAYKKNLIHVLDGNFSFCIWDDKKLVIFFFSKSFFVSIVILFTVKLRHLKSDESSNLFGISHPSRECNKRIFVSLLRNSSGVIIVLVKTDNL